MSKQKISKRVSGAIINSLSAGVVPRIGIDNIAVGREKELKSILQNLEDVSGGGGAFRFIVGNYGSGKSFMLQLIRNQAMEQGFVVADADLSAEKRLTGTNNEGLATYRELVRNVAIKTRPEGGALVSILEGWINKIQQEVAKETGIRPHDEQFDDKVEARILEVVQDIEGLVHGFDFGNVISAYWRGYRLGDEEKKNAALRWLRGEYNTKTEAKAALTAVRVIIDDDTWYDYIKLIAKFTADIGYKGILILLDEAVHLYQIANTIAREKNYDKLLAIFNDTMQGRAEHLGIFVGGTPKFIEDSNRGLFKNPAWQRRTKESRFVKQAGIQDASSPVIQLHPLNTAEIDALLQRIADVHAVNFGYEVKLKQQDFQDFVRAVVSRLGADALLTPGEVVRDFISVLNVLHQNEAIAFTQLIQNTIRTTDQIDTDDAAEFSL